MIPLWLHGLSIASLVIAGVCAVVISLDEARRPQKMAVMNVVWPLTALFGSVIWLRFYQRFAHNAGARPPHWALVGKAASHCGAGCTLGDICAELLCLAFPAIAVIFGWHSLFNDKVLAVWILDFVLAYLFGIVFQYFTIAPMRKLGVAAGLWAAIKADTLSLIAWQVGMYAAMAAAQFWLFRGVLHTSLTAAMPEFWFCMQLAMLCGFATSYPVNAWLLKAGLKETM